METAEIVSNSVLYFVKADNIRWEIISGCCVSFCFPCAVYRDAEALNKSGIFFGLISCFFPCIPTFLLRGEAREKYGIEGSTCGDAMCSFFCNRCVQCQIGNKIEERENLKKKGQTQRYTNTSNSEFTLNKYT